MNKKNLSEAISFLNTHNISYTYKPLKKYKSISILEAILPTINQFGQQALRYFQWYYNNKTEAFLYEGDIKL